MKKYLYLFSLLLLWACGAQSPQEEDTPPNVLLIIGDDHGYADLGSAKLADDVSTPNFDRLAQSGMHFQNAYATSPICSPSRVGLLTGAYHQRQKVFWYGGGGISDPAIPTIAELLLQNGYATGYFGKFHYGSKDTDTAHRSFPLNHGFQELYGCNGGRKHYLIHNNEKEAAFQTKMAKAPKPKQSLRMEGFWNQKQRENIEGFSTEIIAQKGIDFMKRQIDAQQAFFATVSFNAVHNFTHQLPKEYLEEHQLEGYHDWDPDKETYYDWYQKGRKPNNPEGRAHYLGQLHYLDRELGRLLDFLEEADQLENTLIVYIGDNGGSTQIYANNSPFKGGKYTMYEGGLRVPLMISWQGKYAKNQVSKNLVSALDVLPTICEATATPLPKLFDGLSLHSLLNGSNPAIQHEDLFWWGGEQASVRSGDWKYRWANDSDSSFARSSTAYEGVSLELGQFLYQLETPSPEVENVKEQHPEILEKMEAKLDKWKEEVGI